MVHIVDIENCMRALYNGWVYMLCMAVGCRCLLQDSGALGGFIYHEEKKTPQVHGEWVGMHSTGVALLCIGLLGTVQGRGQRTAPWLFIHLSGGACCASAA